MGRSPSVGCHDLPWSDGVFFVDKPAGLTSFAIVRRIRWLLGIKKVGHAGTLDPFATGLLIVCVGRPATRCIDSFMGGRKTYQARLQLGVETETQDPEGAITRTAPVPEWDRPSLVACLRQHVGPQLQAPPPYSAAKHKGKPLYAYARQGVRIEKEAKPIEILSLTLDHYDAQLHQLDLTVTCSPGTYVRVLAADIGRSLGCGAHLIGLRRTASGPFVVGDSLSGAELFTEEGLAVLQAARRGIEETVDIVAPRAI
ncbi:tRNA pseudouridine synthase B [Desulfobulbus propionicus DSM 2032]|jgi:tRNA pseudouridine55 synthase|uniref:tRNA pseudouridine synthase B n=1 Tax=Desulfobulbus propionicus (strain ATCC 33891 / DSM 2032 / VKM B-1956 / 1pr3) TaxID=577650 RepID=A0A7U4DQB7_DESPD|nr:tRNA pseudouridine(55) synthase TruB [Desulfobulbus propionicus]ADW19051.1 tRNA pseudouridine synthase B [Desulfobulbus propionicus DSM 2032]